MTRLLKYQKLQIKSAFRCFAKGLLTMAVLFVLLIGIIFAVMSYRMNSSHAGLINLGVVCDENDTIMKYLVTFAKGMTALEGVCNIETVDKTLAMEEVADGRLDLFIEVPPDFYQKASSMQDVSMKVYVPDDSVIAGRKLFALFDSVENMMITTEGAIYAMYDTMSVYEVDMSIAQMEDTLFGDVINQYMGRDRLFAVIDTSLYGSCSAIQFYIISIIQILSLVCGLFYLKMYLSSYTMLERMMAVSSAQKIGLSVTRIVAMTIPQGLVWSIVVLIYNQVCSALRLYDYIAQRHIFLVIWLYALLVSIYIHLFATALKNSGHCAMIYSLSTLILIIVSGVIVPAVYLPGTIRGLGELMPMSFWQSILVKGMWGYSGELNLFLAVAITLVMLMASIVFYYRRLGAHD